MRCSSEEVRPGRRWGPLCYPPRRPPCDRSRVGSLLRGGGGGGSMAQGPVATGGGGGQGREEGSSAETGGAWVWDRAPALHPHLPASCALAILAMLFPPQNH